MPTTFVLVAEVVLVFELFSFVSEFCGVQWRHLRDRLSITYRKAEEDGRGGRKAMKEWDGSRMDGGLGQREDTDQLGVQPDHLKYPGVLEGIAHENGQCACALRQRRGATA